MNHDDMILHRELAQRINHCLGYPLRCLSVLRASAMNRLDSNQTLLKEGIKRVSI
jgi:hypothetical protein